MASNDKVVPSPLGCVTIEHRQTERSRRLSEKASVRDVCHLVWRPSAPLLDHVPKDFSIVINSWKESDQLRRFAPAEGLDDFIVPASLAGTAVLTVRRQLDGEARHSYRVMRHIYQWAPRLREHFKRSTTEGKHFDGFVRGRQMLPEDLGCTVDGQGQPWTIAELKQAGRAAARANRCSKPDAATCLRLGFLEAAQLNPIDPTSLSENQARGLVRLALFDLGPALVDTATYDRVVERVLQAIEKHLGDDKASFDRWFFENLDNIAHQVSKKRKAGGEISREDTRQAILELVFQSYTYVGDTVHLFMEDFRRALPMGLNEDERALFDALYHKQTFLGGLPLVLLQERFSFLREAMLDLLASPHDRHRIGSLLRLLDYYGALATRKRATDRTYKKRAAARNVRGSVARERKIADDDQTHAGASNWLQDVAAEIREQEKAHCKCGTLVHWHATVREANEKEVILDDGCGECGHTADFHVPLDRFRALTREAQRPD